MPKSEIHRYELVERIAVGGMAEVFRAKTYGLHGFEKELAVKRILPELVSSREFVDRFISEAKIAVTLNHANIVQVTDFSRFADSLYIAMEFVDGLDLRALLSALRDDGCVMPMAAALHICIEVLKGLDFAHGRGVVHRDISPANILLSKSGEVKIADFGIAQASENGSGHTEPFRIMGKWRYMSPEQSLGEKLGASSDLFSFAVVMFELFTGERLFNQEGVEGIVRAIRFHDFPAPSSLRPELPGAIDQLIAQALHRVPEQRGNAASLGRALLELSYAKTIPVTASDLAALVKNYSKSPKRESRAGLTPGALIDNIINSELEQRRPGIKTRLTRLTPVDGPDASASSLSHASMDMSGTNLTFVDGGQGEDGITQWLLGSAEGGPLEVPAELSDELPTVARRPAVAEPLSLAMPAPVDAVLPRDAEPLVDAQRPYFDGYEHPASHNKVELAKPQYTRVLIAALAGIAVALGVMLFVQRRTSGSEVTTNSVAADADASVQAPLALPTDASLSRALPLPARDIDASAIAAESMDFTARLEVETEPAGASISLDGEYIGTSPLRAELPASGTTQRLNLSLEGFRSHSQMVVLEAGVVTLLSEQLRQRPRDGEIDLFVKPWAEVYLGQKKIGEAPMRALSLPHGTHRLRLVNPVTGAEKTVTVQVPASKAYHFLLDN